MNGTIGRAAHAGDAPLELEAQLSVQRVLVKPLRDTGLRVGRGGRATVRIGGTLSNPSVR